MVTKNLTIFSATRPIGILAVLFLVIVLGMTMPVSASWEKYVDNPVLGTVDAGAQFGDPAIFYESGTWYLFVDNLNTDNIDLYTSPNGTSFVFNSTPISKVAATWESNHVRDPTVVKVGSVYHMWYTGNSGSSGTGFKIGHATASSLTGTWTKDGSNPVFSRGSEGVNEPSVIYESGAPSGYEYKMLFTAGIGSSDDIGSGDIGYAYSSDGTNWTDYGDVLTGIYQDQEQIKIGSNYYMFVNPYGSDIARSVSTNHIDWSIPSSTGGFNSTAGTLDSVAMYAPGIAYINDEYWMYYQASNGAHHIIALAKSDTIVNIPEFDDVSWDHDPYYTGETANITTNILNFDSGTYSYYLDLYSADDYLTTFELTSETESNYYTFPLDWADTSLLAKLMRVTDPYATNEVELAYDVSFFESLYWDTTVVFNKSSYNPSDTLKVTWSGAASGSSVWLQAGDDGEVLESDVAYSGSFTFDVPANTTETYYWVDVVTDGYSQAFAICDISPVPDFFFNYSVAVDQDEYYHGDWVTVTYSTDTPAVIKVFDDTNADIWHYLDVPAAVINETWIYYIGDTDPFGSYSVLFGNDNFLVSDYYSVVSSTSFVQVVPESMYMYETMRIWYVTNGSSTLSIKDSSDSILFNQTVNSSSLESISYIPTVSGILTITLSDVPTDATDSIVVYWAEDPDDVPDDDIEDDVIEDVLGDDETMTEYYNEKFRDFAPTIWGFFMLMCLLFLMSILTSFNSGGKR